MLTIPALRRLSLGRKNSTEIGPSSWKSLRLRWKNSSAHMACRYNSQKQKNLRLPCSFNKQNISRSFTLNSARQSPGLRTRCAYWSRQKSPRWTPRANSPLTPGAYKLLHCNYRDATILACAQPQHLHGNWIYERAKRQWLKAITRLAFILTDPLLRYCNKFFCYR